MLSFINCFEIKFDSLQTSAKPASDLIKLLLKKIGDREDVEDDEEDEQFVCDDESPMLLFTLGTLLMQSLNSCKLTGATDVVVISLNDTNIQMNSNNLFFFF
jgi:hypothetical protein